MPPNEGIREQHRSSSGSEIGRQQAVWVKALRERGCSALGLPGEGVLFLGCGTSAFASRISSVGFRQSDFVTESLPSLREGAGVGEADAAYA